MQLRHLSLLSSSQQASKELTEVLNQIWSLDANRLRPGTDYVISLQVRHKSLKLSHMVQILYVMHVMVYSAKKKSCSNANTQCSRQLQGHTTASVI